MNRIQASTKIYEVFRRHPKAADYLLEMGICECQGLRCLKSSIAEEAESRGLDTETLLEELNKRA